MCCDRGELGWQLAGCMPTQFVHSVLCCAVCCANSIGINGRGSSGLGGYCRLYCLPASAAVGVDVGTGPGWLVSCCVCADVGVTWVCAVVCVLCRLTRHHVFADKLHLKGFVLRVTLLCVYIY